MSAVAWMAGAVRDISHPAQESDAVDSTEDPLILARYIKSHLQENLPPGHGS
ncbi:hypothetical protein H9Y04_23675 [Streptomyces sp. TRM66268-LWL]|uniref:Uncharacterized protein n=1 Tax=Streptomyces polyasparticus TaxID=2767826 RepID=A0ABR7SMF6_9ACTN|nr:hypothetical protein [Streptomyces polyasparticus]MBC9715553.1 hypothetical protein [Streptomyces polyasparticus]